MVEYLSFREQQVVYMLLRYLVRHIRHAVLSRHAVVFGLSLTVLAGCASESLPARRFAELLSRYPSTEATLGVPILGPATVETVPAELKGKAIAIIVHPGYSLFFREEHKNRYADAKFELLKIQLENEEQFIREISGTDHILVLVLPGDYQHESVAPLSYTYYLNKATGGSRTVYAVYSETSSSGVLPTESLVNLYSFLRGAGTKMVLVGGGYIGRCQREFYNQLVTYVDNISFYVAPEISSISPDDITNRESVEILEGIRAGDYSPVDAFIEKRTKGLARTRSLADL